MAGHNKWSKIKHKKASTDAQKSKAFSKTIQLLTNEAKRCSGNLDDPELRALVKKAKSINMPLQNIERAINAGAKKDGANYEDVSYESYGPGGCAILIETTTDNRNRTAAEVRHILSKHGYSIGAKGSASWMFSKEGDETVAKNKVKISEEDEKKFSSLMADLEEQADVQYIYTNKE